VRASNIATLPREGRRVRLPLSHFRSLTSIERLAKQEGRAEGKAELLLRALTRKYGVVVPETVSAPIRGTRDSALLEGWLDLVFEAATLEEFQQRMHS
jgi:hypothetical protein